MLAVLLLLAAQAAPDSFESRVRPLLARQCIGCHGAEKQFGALRLDSREAMLAGGKRGPAIVPGDPSNSLLLKAMRHENGLAMPMSAPRLSAAEIAPVEQWLRDGAPWPKASAVPREPGWYERAARTHWAFRPVRPPPPGADIDGFLLARLKAKGLQPAPPADRRTLIRRASLLFTGLPPTANEIDAFLRDASPRAWEHVVDRLLASPHFGEQWARHWMDVMRYAETRGYEWNYVIVGAWRYRDYLIRAFNNDVPYDQLVREHIAGDLLARPRVDERARLNESIIGTASFRLGEAGHDDCVQFREISLDVVDNQIDTLGKAFQGLTVACARCHDHKLDPIPTADYYSWFGILNGSRAVTHTIDKLGSFGSQKASLDRQKRAIRDQLARVWGSEIERNEPNVRRAAFDDPAFPQLAMSRTDPARFREVFAGLAAVYRAETARRAAFNRERFVPYVEPREWFRDGLGLDGESAPGELAVATQGDAALTAILPAGLYTNRHTDRWNGALRSPVLPKTHKYLSLRVAGGGFAARRAVLDNCAIGEGYRVLDDATPRWYRLDTYAKEELHTFAEVITKQNNPRIPDRPGVIKATAAELASARSWFGVSGAVLHDTPKPPLEELGHMARLFADPVPRTAAELTARYRAVTTAAVEAWTTGRATGDDIRWLNAMIRAGMLANRADASPDLSTAIAGYRATEATLPEPRVIDGIGDAGAGYDAHVLRGGNPGAPGDVAPRGYLSRIPSDAEPFHGAGSGRLELAEAIASPSNPLTARVMANRIWHHLFGRGLVPTVDNFGRQGEPPAHPELLDYLAAGFVREGWSVKNLVREIALSAAFQQSNTPTAAAREADPGNTLLHHFRPRRMTGEAIRDSILAASGRLDRTLYGPSISPPRNEPQDYRKLYNGPLDGNGRRSIYTEVTRMEGSRFLEIFDFPNPMAARGARDVTNVPAQALALLNDPFVHQQAQGWADRLAGFAGSPESRVDDMFRTALGRPASVEEQKRFAALGMSLGWKEVAHAIFNFEEFLYVP
ncbi:MAG: PSD1 and planctomycete cytochrome C domain-containing protein [Bryobacteraceae bacterium]